jgi:reductive dehalogenase
MNRVIVMAFEMDYDAIMSYETAIGAAGAGDGYSRMSVTTASLAEFIRKLGYNAIPCGNMTGLSVPMAIDAGLGEFGRNGILITPKYGPRVRLAKVITDMPMETDHPISFGVKEFCDVCGKCADACPGDAISKEKQTWEQKSISNNPGVKRWPLDAVKCLATWQSLGGSDCGTCIRSCPFNKVDSWLHEITRIMIGAKSGNIDALMDKMDTGAGFGKQQDPEDFWKKDRFIHTNTYDS